MTHPTTPIFAPLNNVNDETVLIVDVRCKDGDLVKKEDVLLVAETSKATFEVAAPTDGYVRVFVALGQEVPIGEALCVLAEACDALPPAGAPAPKAPAPACQGGAAAGAPPPGGTTAPAGDETQSVFAHAAEVPPTAAPPRFSEKARALIDAERVDPADFAGHGLVRSQDVLGRLGRPAAPRGSAAQASAAEDCPLVAGVPFCEVPLSKSKRTEISLLTEAQTAAVTSQVSTLVPSGGVFAACAREPEFAGEMSSRTIFEVARVLKAFPMFNAGYRAGHRVEYSHANIGYALDIGHGLKVPVVHSAERASLEEIHWRKKALIEKYLLSALTIDDLAGGTFTITDLSGEDCWLFNPIVNRGQAAILGVTSEYAIGGGECAYALVLAFDHRLAEGLVASRFLAELKRRLMAHHAVVLARTAAAPQEAAEARCAECYRVHSLIGSLGGHLLTTTGPSGKARPVCSVCMAGH